MSTNLKYTIACSVLAAGLAVPFGFASAAEQRIVEHNLNALKPKTPLTRSLSVSPAEQAKKAETRRSSSIRCATGRRARCRSTSASRSRRSRRTKPRIDLEIKFDFNSANIAQERDVRTWTMLGKALSDPALKGSTFVLAGHTDAVGGEEFNQDLSNRRADAVKTLPDRQVRPGAGNLVTAGYGKSRLKNKDNPRARREPPRRSRQHGGEVSRPHRRDGPPANPGGPCFCAAAHDCWLRMKIVARRDRPDGRGGVRGAALQQLGAGLMRQPAPW